MGGVVLFFGGNGHTRQRLAAARAVLADREPALVLVDVPYPGFEDRPRAASLESFLDEISREYRIHDGSALAGYATGIGALIALELRARGLLRIPFVFQGPVLWGLEQRTFPRLMAWRPARQLLQWSLGRNWVQARLARRLFVAPLDRPARAAFFDGYRRCAAFGDLFTWLTPQWLRTLEQQFAAHPDRLDEITVWAGSRDRVVGPGELTATERALGVQWPLIAFPRWGHYPMIDEPEEWADALANALAVA